MTLATFLERQSGEEAKNAIKSEQKNETNNAKKKGRQKMVRKTITNGLKKTKNMTKR